jgi:hypothetical protein
MDMKVGDEPHNPKKQHHGGGVNLLPGASWIRANEQTDGRTPKKNGAATASDIL